MRASLLTRVVYALGLLAFIPGTLAAGSGWIALATGGGVAAFGATAVFVIAALIVFRCYQVLRYPAALDSRKPNALGWILRVLGWWSMAGAAVAGIGLFLVGPVTRTLTGGSVGESGVAYFMVGLMLSVGAGVGWVGCLLFEISRVCGAQQEAAVPWSRRRQDFGVLASLVIAAVAGPYVVATQAPLACGESGLASCVSTTQAQVHRVIALPYEEPVALESMLSEIEFRSSAGRKWSLKENPGVSLRMAGHPPAMGPARVRVGLDAVQSGTTIVVTMVVRDGEEETARFITTYPKDAVIEKRESGNLVTVHLPSNAQPGARPAERGPSGTQYLPDQIYVQLRRAIGTEEEARDWPRRAVLEARLVTSSSGGGSSPFRESNIDAACKGVIDTAPSKGAPSFEGSWLWPLHAAAFAQSFAPGPKALFDHRDRISCRDGKIWIVSYQVRRPQVQVRRYSAVGELERFIETTIPRPRLGGSEYDEIDAATLKEEGGRLRFDRLIMKVGSGNPQEKLRETFEVAL